MKHLLKEYGILSSFSIRHKINYEEFEKVYKEVKKKFKTKTDEEIRNEVESILDKDSENNIPGIIPLNYKELRTKELYERAIVLASLISKDESIEKYEIIFLLNVMSKILNIEEDNSKN